VKRILLVVTKQTHTLTLGYKTNGLEELESIKYRGSTLIKYGIHIILMTQNQYV